MERKQERTPVYAGVYEEIAEIIGEERIGEFYERFKGQQFVFPMKLYSKESGVVKSCGFLQRLKMWILTVSWRVLQGNIAVEISLFHVW